MTDSLLADRPNVVDSAGFGMSIPIRYLLFLAALVWTTLPGARAASYIALVVKPDSGSGGGATGVIRFEVNRLGSLNGTIVWRQQTYRISGQLDGSKSLQTSASPVRSGVDPLAVHIQIEDDQGGFSGALTDVFSEVTFHREGRGPVEALHFTGALALEAKVATGYVVGRVTASGRVRLAGRFPLGQSFTLSAQTDRTGRAVIYQRVALPGNKSRLAYGLLDVPSTASGMGSLFGLRFTPQASPPADWDPDYLYVDFELGTFKTAKVGHPTIAWPRHLWNVRTWFFDGRQRSSAMVQTTVSGSDQFAFGTTRSAAILGITVNRSNGVFHAATMSREAGFRAFTGVFVQGWGCGVGQSTGPGGFRSIFFDTLGD
jgi:hypothetical protein